MADYLMNKLTSSLKPHLLLRLRNRHFMLLDALMLRDPALALMLRVDGVQALITYAEALLLYCRSPGHSVVHFLRQRPL